MEHSGEQAGQQGYIELAIRSQFKPVSGVNLHGFSNDKPEMIFNVAQNTMVTL